MNESQLRHARQTLHFITNNPNRPWVQKLKDEDVRLLQLATSLEDVDPQGSSPYSQEYSNTPRPLEAPDGWLVDDNQPKQYIKSTVRLIQTLARAGYIPPIPARRQ